MTGLSDKTASPGPEPSQNGPSNTSYDWMAASAPVAASCVRSPRFGIIALAYLHRSINQPGNQVRVAEVEATAFKRVVAYQLEELMKQQKLTKTEMAQRIQTSRASLDRLLDPSNPSVTLKTLERAATALGKRLRIELV